MPRVSLPATAQIPPALPYPSARYAWFVMSIFFLAAIVSYTDRLILNLLVDPIRQELGVTDTDVSLLQGAAFALIYGILGLPLGRFADRHNRRNLIIAGILVWSVATAACGFARTFWQLFAARVFVGVGEAALAPAVMSLIPDYFPPERRGTAISVFLMGGQAGAGLAFIIGGVLVDAFAIGHFAFVPLVGQMPPWRAVLISLALPGVLIAGLLFSVQEPVRRERGASATRSLGDLARYFRLNAAAVFLILIAHALINLCDYGQSAWFPSVLTRRFHLSETQIGSYIGIVGTLASFAGTLLGGVLADRWQKKGALDGRARVMLIAYVAVVPLLIFPVLPALLPVMLVDCLCTVAISAGGTAGIAAIQEAVPNDMRGISVSFQALTYTLIGLGAGPTLVALTTDHVFHDPAAVGWSIVVVTVPVAVLAVLMSWVSLSHYRETRRRLLVHESA